MPSLLWFFLILGFLHFSCSHYFKRKQDDDKRKGSLLHTNQVKGIKRMRNTRERYRAKQEEKSKKESEMSNGLSNRKKHEEEDEGK